MTLAAVVVVLAGALALAAAITGPAYAFTTVSIPNEDTTQVTGINSAGAYTGLACNSACRAPVFFVSEGGVRTEFTIPFKDFVPTAAAGPSGIDNAGEIVGIYNDAKGVQHGFIRSPSGAMTELNVPGAAKVRGGGTGIDGISASGIIVGDYFDRRGVERGFIDQHGQFVTYNEPKAGTAKGTGTQVNFYSDDEFGGLYFADNGSAHGFYVLGGQAHTVDSPTLPTPTKGFGTELVGISSNGTLYGTVSSPGAAATEAFADHNGTFKTIESPNQIQTADSDGTQIFNVNGTGVVVGDYTYNASGDTLGVIARLTDTTWLARVHHLISRVV